MSELRSKEDYAKEYSKLISWSEQDKVYVARIAELPGCVTHGNTTKEVFEMAEEAAVAYLEVLEAKGEPFPIPAGRSNEEARFLVRLDMPTHQFIKFLAQEVGMSMNEYIVDKLRTLGGVEYHLSDPKKLREFKEQEAATKRAQDKHSVSRQASGRIIRGQTFRKPPARGTTKKAR